MSTASRKVKIMEVTPEVATRWLEKNTHNRDFRQKKAEQFAEAIKAGAWQLTAEPIAFCLPWTDSAGNPQEETLINGQHRLWAVILANKPAWFTVWWGCGHEEFAVIDQGTARTQGDVLKTIRPDLEDPTKLVSVIGPIVNYDFSKRNKLMSHNTELMLRAFPHELDITVMCRQRLGNRICTAPVTAALFLSSLIDEARTGALVERLHTAVGFTEKDPVRALHFYLHAQLDAKTRETREMIHYKTINACLAQIDGKPLQRLQPHIDYLGEARRRTKDKIDGTVRELHGGKLPEFFYHPRNSVFSKEGVRSRKATGVSEVAA